MFSFLTNRFKFAAKKLSKTLPPKMGILGLAVVIIGWHYQDLNLDFAATTKAIAAYFSLSDSIVIKISLIGFATRPTALQH